MEQSLVPSRYTYAGVFLVALATLMHEILLTRIFSVTMGYHFAFVAISVAMFGMTVGALVVFLRSDRFAPDRTRRMLAVSGVALPWALVLSFLTQLSVPFRVHPSVVAAYAIVFTYAVISVPFVVSGVAVCLALTRFSAKVGRVYAADLAGAAVGCVLLVGVLSFTDAATSVFVVATLAALGGVLLALDGRSRAVTRLAVATVVLLGLFSAGHTVMVWKQFPILRILYVKGQLEARPLYEKWNSYSRVRVNGDENKAEDPYTWGLSSVYPPERSVRQLHMDIDVNAGTVMTRFDGRFDESLEHLKYDVTNVGYYLRPDAKVFIVGTGGGRDILSALSFGAKSVVGVELNKDIIATMNQRFGAFTGHLDRDPRVRFVNDEARSYISRQQDKFDFVQISLIDTWAATAAGAFVLSENSLYTADAWRIFINHLTDRGVFSVSRWYLADLPGETYRLTTLAVTGLQEVGVTDPRRHIVIVRNMSPLRLRGTGSAQNAGVGTMLVARQPFSDQDLDTLEAVCARMKFDIVLSPRAAVDPTFARIASGRDLKAITDSFPVNIAAPTDDSPFFFHVLRMRDILRWDKLPQSVRTQNTEAVFVLAALLTAVLLLTVLCIFVPLRLTARRLPIEGNRWLLVFFAAIGLGFMLVETSQMQRLIIVLGHPTYALSVVLFSLLLSSGAGSYLTERVDAARAKQSGLWRFGALLALLAVFGVVTPFLVRSFEGSEGVVRVLVAVAVLLPLGLFMGMAFPLGMKMAARRAPALTPWLWGVNGATSVLASVMTIAIALTWTISTAFWTGFACYAVAAAAYWKACETAERVEPAVVGK